MSGHEVAVPHPAMELAARALPLLNRYTAEVLERAAAVDVPDGWTLMVAADSGLVLAHPLSGDYVTFRLVGGGSAERQASWRPVSGSLHEDGPAFDDNLTRVVSYFVTQHARKQIRVSR
jgi:hypothetical protein